MLGNSKRGADGVEKTTQAKSQHVSFIHHPLAVRSPCMTGSIPNPHFSCCDRPRAGKIRQKAIKKILEKASLQQAIASAPRYLAFMFLYNPTQQSPASSLLHHTHKIPTTPGIYRMRDHARPASDSGV
jgi:hypothetical protein